MSNPKVKIAVLKNLLIFDEKYLPQSVRLLEGGGVETLFGRIPFEHRSFLHGSSLRVAKSKSYGVGLCEGGFVDLLSAVFLSVKKSQSAYTIKGF